MMARKRIPNPPVGWGYGVVLRPHTHLTGGSNLNRVMFIRMLAPDEGPTSGIAYFEGMTVTTDAYGERIGKLHRLDHFPVGGWRVDA